jgi:hypothetical protein
MQPSPDIVSSDTWLGASVYFCIHDVIDNTLCLTLFNYISCAAPGDNNYKKCWTAVFARRQPDQKNNPNKATFRANWRAASKANPDLKSDAKKIFSLLKKQYPLKKASLRIPFTRVCKPSAYGLKNCGLQEGMRTGRVNPNGYPTDAKSKLFYKFFWDGRNKIVAGKTGH